jgi:hypothetical protein
MKHPFLLNKTYHEWAEPFISLEQLKKLSKQSQDTDFYLTTQGPDELITDANPVDLARGVVEQIYTLKGEKYQFIVNDKLFISHEPFVTSDEIRAVGQIPTEEILFFKVDGPDRELKKGQCIDLKPYPIEEFYSIPSKLVKITINNHPYEIKPGKYSVADIKKIGNVSPTHDLDQLINGELVPLKDDGQVIIRGCEEFKSHPKDGCSS